MSMIAAGIQPVRLRCEYREDPLGIDERVPRLSWALESEARNQRQSAYRILVAANEEDLEAEQNLLWDSGRVESGRTVGVEYEGEALRSGSRCVWKIRVWDGADGASPFSELAVLEMGLLERSDWNGTWISAGKDPDKDFDPPSGDEYDDLANGLTPSPYLRMEFSLDSSVRTARLYATARGVYELYLNGKRVGADVLAPGWTDYDQRVQYQSYDVTPLLADGPNALGAVLGDGWFAGFVGFDPKHRGALYGPRPQLLAQLNLEYEDGTKETIATDGSWSCSTGPILFSDLLMGESYDARKEMPGWNESGFDDSAWFGVEAEEIGDTNLVAQPDEGIRVTEEIEAKTVTEPESGVYVFDLGRNMVGWVRLKVEGEAGTEVTLRHTEALNPDGSVYTTNLRSARATDHYVLAGDGEEVYEPRFTFHGFCYVEVTGYPGEPPLGAVTGRVVHSATPPTGSFECSSEMVDKLQENILWGQRGNFLSVPTDCPQRDERLGWMGDAQVFVRTAAFNMDVAAFFEKWMVDVEDAQSPEGAFPDVAPLLRGSGLIDLRWGAPAWGDAGVIVPWTIYRTYDDTRIVERHYDAMTRWMEYLYEGNPNFLRKNRMGNNYGDWLSPRGDHTPKHLLATAYWAYDAKLMAEMAGVTGRHEDAKKYRDLHERIRAAFNDAYVAPDGRIEGDTQTCYLLALHMGLLPEELRATAAAHLVRAIEREDWHLSTGFAGVGYLCPVLTETGHTDVAHRLLNNETYPSWGYTIKNGATTIWERWDGWTEEDGFQSPNMNSFNHYSLGSVGEWLYRYVAGIDLGTPGYGRIVIRPRPGGGLTHAKAEYDSVRGRISSAWKIEDDRFELEVIIPPNTTATVHVPVADGVSEGGKPVEEAEAVEFISAGAGETVLAVGSGRYEFAGMVVRE
ncbi:MAG TPA: glycoside hydrolase family 78 protein, partial [Rubrobacter sp.]|nr:glycoside hydrolase family 78 protein [Rubrobacter sp.]